MQHESPDIPFKGLRFFTLWLQYWIQNKPESVIKETCKLTKKKHFSYKCVRLYEESLSNIQFFLILNARNNKNSASGENMLSFVLTFEIEQHSTEFLPFATYLFDFQHSSFVFLWCSLLKGNRTRNFLVLINSLLFLPFSLNKQELV